MSVLDEHFGPNETTELRRMTSEELMAAADPFRPRKGNSWRCAERLHPMLNAFAEEFPEFIPRGSKSSLYRSAERLYEEVGGSPDYIHWAAKQLKAKNLDPKNLFSLGSMWLVGQWRKRLAVNDREKYYEGGLICRIHHMYPCPCLDDDSND